MIGQDIYIIYLSNIWERELQPHTLKIEYSSSHWRLIYIQISIIYTNQIGGTIIWSDKILFNQYLGGELQPHTLKIEYSSSHWRLIYIYSNINNIYQSNRGVQ